MNQWFAEQLKSLPENIKEELNVFFHPDSFFGMSMIQVFYMTKKYGSIDESIEILKTVDAKRLISMFFNTGQNTLEDYSIIDNPEKVHEYVKNSTLPMNEKSKLFYLYFNPEDTMERLVNLIQYCYENLYKPNALEIEKIQAEAFENVKKLSVPQLSEIFSFDHKSPEKLPESIIIFPSYYHQHETTFSYNSMNDTAISIAGVQLIEDLLVGNDKEEEIIELARALSDNKRLNIIRELNKAPHYGYELAQKLDLTSPTVSHHMNVLFRLGLVTTSKYENKIYYEVNKEKLRQALEDMANFLS